jgi:hypothetical protein
MDRPTFVGVGVWDWIRSHQGQIFYTKQRKDFRYVMLGRWSLSGRQESSNRHLRLQERPRESSLSWAFGH